MAGYCQGGDAWRSYIHGATDNKGSNWPESTWNLMQDIGSYFLRDRVWRPGHGERSLDDVRALRLRGFFHGIITVAQWHDTDHPVPLLGAADWQREMGPILDAHAGALGVRWPVTPWNENIDHTNAVTSGPGILRALLDAGEEGMVVPASAVGSPQEPVYRAAMDGCYRDPRTAGICLHVRENNLTDVDDYRARYPDKRLFITEFGFEHTPDEATRIRVAEQFVLKWLDDPMVAGIAWFTLPCKDGAWAGHYQTPAEQTQWKRLCVAWRQARLYPTPPPAVPPVQPTEEPPIPANGGATAQQFPGEWASWVAAGGPENNFRTHLLGIGLITPATEDLFLINAETGARVAQMRGALQRFPFPR